MIIFTTIWLIIDIFYIHLSAINQLLFIETIMNKKLLLFSVLLSSVAYVPLVAQNNDVVTYVVLHNTSDNSVSSRIDYTYDTQGRVIEELTTVPGADNKEELINSAKIIYGYDDQGRRNVVEKYLYNENTWTWYANDIDDDAKTVTTFNDDGRPSEIYYYGTFDGNSWGDETQFKYHGVFTYANNTSTEKRYQQKNGIPQADPSQIVEYTYDDNLRIVGKIKYTYAFDFAVYDYITKPTDKWTYEYNENSDITLEEHFTYVEDESGEEEGGDDPYDPWGDYSTKDSAKPLADENAWVRLTSYKYEYTYNPEGKISRLVTYWWFDDLSDYDVYSDLTYEYFYGSNDALELDYSNNFDAADALEGFFTEDGNKDENTWKLANGALSCTSTSASEAPDIIYLPAIRFSTDNEVEICLKARIADTAKPAKIQLILCNNNASHTALGTIGDIHNITSTEYTEVTGRIVPDKNSPYVIGICFDNAQVGSTIVIDDLTVKSGRSTDTPLYPYNVTATPEQTGKLEVQIKYTATPYTIGGEYLNSVDKTEVYRDGVEEPVYTTNEISTSLEQHFIDNTIPEKGEYTYRIYSYKGDLRSDAAVVTVKVGYPVPQAVSNLKIVENADHSITISWDAPADTDGNVKYYIVRNNEVELETEFEGTSYTDSSIDTSLGQVYCYYYIQPYNEIGYGKGTTTDLYFVGEPNPTPFKESWAGGTGTYLWMNEIVSGFDPAWGEGSSLSEIIYPQDEDGGLAGFLSTNLAKGDIVRYSSEKIDLSNTTAPEISFYIYIYSGEVSNDAIVIEASTDNGEFQIVSDPISASLPETSGWQQRIVPLEGFAGEKNVRIAFRGISDATYNIAIDNVVVAEKGYTSINENTAMANARVYAAGGTITVETDMPSDIRIYSISGTPVYTANGQTANVQAAPGAYIVTVNGSATKVLVK